MNIQESLGVQVGDGNRQTNYFYNRGPLADGTSPPPIIVAGGEVESPYRGLGAFSEDDAPYFFGRDDIIAEVLAQMSDRVADQSVVIVSGASGAGKSSLLQAGVLPRLRGTGLTAAPEAASWPCVIFTPGRSPLAELASRTAHLTPGSNPAAILSTLEEAPDSYPLFARNAALAQAASAPVGMRRKLEPRLLLVVDQFEQAFTQCKDPFERQAFITAVTAAADGTRTPGGQPAALVVLSVRADFEARCADYPELADAVKSHRCLVTPMSERQLHLAITGPALAARSQVEDSLASQLLREVRSRQTGNTSAGVLPLLSHALDQAWRSRPDPAAPLGLADYERAGGIEGAVAISAERAYASLTPRQREAARQVFTRLVTASTDGTDTADRATRAELTAGKSPAEAADVEAVLEAFAGERLLTLAADSVEISHEALLTAWPLLRDTWLAETRADRMVRDRLTATAAEWVRASRDRAYLYTGSRLEEAKRVTERIEADKRHTALTSDEENFLQASRHAVSRSARLRSGFTAAMAVLAAGLVIALIIATQTAGDLLRERDSAQAATAAAVSGRLVSDSLAADDSDPGRARLESAIAWHLDQTTQARYALLAAASNPLANALAAADPPVSAAYNPAGTILALGEISPTGTAAVQLVNPATGTAIGGPLLSARSAGTTGAVSVAFTPDGTTVAVGTGNVVTLWNVATRRVTATFASRTIAMIDSLAFSPGGQTLAVGASMCLGLAKYTNCAEIWSASTGTVIGGPFDTESTVYGQSLQVAFSPDGATVATGGSGGVVRLWSATTRRQESPAFTRLGTVITSLTFSPDGRMLATGNTDGAVRLWNAATGRQAGQALSGSGAIVTSVAFSPDGSLIAAGGSNDMAKVWDVVTRQQVGPALSGGTDDVNAVAFSPSGATLVSADEDGTVRWWTLAALTGHQAGQRISPAYPLIMNGSVIQGGAVYSGPVSAMAFSPQGKLAIFDGGDIGFWNVTGAASSPDYPAASLPANSGYTAIALSPDGGMLATGMANGTVRISDPVKTIKTIGAPKDAAGDEIQAMAFSPDGRELAVSYSGGPLQLIDVATGRPVGSPLQVIGNSGVPFLALAFGPDGQVLTVDSAGTVSTWDPLTSTRTAQYLISGGGGQLKAAAFSPDGNTLALGYGNDTVRLWDLATEQQIGIAASAIGQSVESLAFNSNGTMIAVGGVNASSIPVVLLWNVSYLAATDALSQTCAAIGGVSEAEWTHYVPGLPYEKVCP